MANWHFLEARKDVRLTRTMTHLKDPANLVYMLGRDGELYEVDVSTLNARLLEDLTTRLGRKRRDHCKGALTGQGRVVANNGFSEFGEEHPGLAEFDGAKWNILSRKPHMAASPTWNAWAAKTWATSSSAPAGRKAPSCSEPALKANRSATASPKEDTFTTTRGKPTRLTNRIDAHPRSGNRTLPFEDSCPKFGKNRVSLRKSGSSLPPTRSRSLQGDG
jgi:hypothetical protein